MIRVSLGLAISIRSSPPGRPIELEVISHGRNLRDARLDRRQRAGRDLRRQHRGLAQSGRRDRPR